MYVYVCVYACMYMCVCMYVRMNICVCVYICMYVCAVCVNMALYGIMTMDDKLGKLWNYTAVAYFKNIYRHIPRRTDGRQIGIPHSTPRRSRYVMDRTSLNTFC
jgi:hypothetical protein